MTEFSVCSIPRDTLQGKLVLVRTDFNVPLVRGKAAGEMLVSNDLRIRDSLETLQFFVEAGARVVVCSHLGRPKGRRAEELSLLPVAKKLNELLPAQSVDFIPETIGDNVQQKIRSLHNGDILLLENLRFEEGEESNDLAFAQKLSEGIQVYVNEALSASHRGKKKNLSKKSRLNSSLNYIVHASTVGIAAFIPIRLAGINLERELHYLQEIASNPSRPLIAIIGGKKISSKIGVLLRLLEVVDKMLIGGAMVFTFYRAMGCEVGDSFVEKDSIQSAAEILANAQKNCKVLQLASDFVVISECGAVNTVRFDKLAKGYIGMDIGPTTVKEFQQSLMGASTVLMNGPMGKFEDERFQQGTAQILSHLEDMTTDGVTTVVCGGDTAAAIEQLTFSRGVGFSHVSTGGESALELLAGKILPGVEILQGTKIF